MSHSHLGSRNLNRVLQEALHPPRRQAKVERFGWTFRAADRVIQTENDYDREVFNGDPGVVEAIDALGRELVVVSEGRPVVRRAAALRVGNSSTAGAGVPGNRRRDGRPPPARDTGDVK